MIRLIALSGVVFCVGAYAMDNEQRDTAPPRLGRVVSEAYMGEIERPAPGAWLLEQTCPDSRWLSPVPSQEWNTLELGISWTWQQGKAGLHPYTRYTCPSGVTGARP